ncbi:extradiol dioxygenase [Herbaspirillum sp. LeCh32-8]|uniref:extradiol dioxygenase n=1 Tax=Herbaspirillum sp. LeCh32-8 TaxID=2821356 RepID=UPI001AE64F9C|nr:extradiol dioxygenase [Herbaspirillum sp. LeCh32-8]MBP0596932.1 extradiol dioxygenase [Herbaspirillum sp. LeCh32-8]
MQLDHITIVAHECACLRSFFVDVVGLKEGARPPFGISGHWLYLDSQPVLHLIERPDAPSGAGVRIGGPPARIDHMALRIDSLIEWQQLLRRLRERQIPYQLSGMRAQQEQQLFVTPVPDVTVEFVIDGRYLA